MHHEMKKEIKMLFKAKKDKEINQHGAKFSGVLGQNQAGEVPVEKVEEKRGEVLKLLDKKDMKKKKESL